LWRGISRKWILLLCRFRFCAVARASNYESRKRFHSIQRAFAHERLLHFLTPCWQGEHRVIAQLLVIVAVLLIQVPDHRFFARTSPEPNTPSGSASGGRASIRSAAAAGASAVGLAEQKCATIETDSSGSLIRLTRYNFQDYIVKRRRTRKFYKEVGSYSDIVLSRGS
jgi:hypothetical protein